MPACFYVLTFLTLQPIYVLTLLFSSGIDQVFIMETMEFDTLERIQISITIKDTGRQFVLMEALEADINRYKDLQLSKAKINEGEFAGIEGIHVTEASFLASCLYEKKDNGQLEQCDLDTVVSLPGRISKKLFKKLEHISGLDDDKSVEQIRKEMKTLQKKLDKMSDNKGELEDGNPLKN